MTTASLVPSRAAESGAARVERVAARVERVAAGVMNASAMHATSSMTDVSRGHGIVRTTVSL